MLNCPFVGGPSAAFAAQIADETGSGALAFATSPTFVTPVLGTPSSGTLSSCTAAIDSTAGVMSAADHTTLTALSGQTSGTAPPFVAVGLLSIGYKTGVDLKTNGVTSIFTVPASRTFIAVSAVVVPTAVSGGAAVTFTYLIRESGASVSMTTASAAGSAAPVTTKCWVQNNLTGGNLLGNCAAGNNVQISITTGFTTSTSVSGSVFVVGFYCT